MNNLIKYPRTPHLEGSKLQEGDSCEGQVLIKSLQGQNVVIEEKVDGGNSGISFSEGGDLLLQSRGHYLVGGGRERQFNLFKKWATAHESTFLSVLEDRYIMYGEWMHKKHSVYYDKLPHYFLEFDVWDKKLSRFLSTPARKLLLKGLPVLSVPVLYTGLMPSSLKEIKSMVNPSLARTGDWLEKYISDADDSGMTREQALRMVDMSLKAEGLYIKVETEDETVARYKWVRSDFVQTILDTNVHHSNQPYVANRLESGVDIYSPRLTHTWGD